MSWPVEIDPTFGCRLWKGRLDRDGYPMTSDGKRAHREVYIAAGPPFGGPIPPDHDLDHHCRRRRCVWELHLEPVTQSKNEHRKHWRSRLRMKVCRAGHDLQLNGIVTPEGGRVCRTCVREGLP